MSVTSLIDLPGERVRLRTTTEFDRSALVAIRATEEVRRHWRGEDLESEFDRALDHDGVVRLTIEDDGGEIIGLIQFAEEEDPDYRHASLDIYIDPAVHRRGHASDAIRTLVGYLFDTRGHHRLTIDPSASNAAAIGCYASVGFVPIGVMRRYERQPDGAWTDGLLMELVVGDPKKVEDDAVETVRQAEVHLLDSEVRGDRRALEALLHPDFVEFGSSGRVWTRHEIIEELAISPDPGPLVVTEMEVRRVAADCIVVTYRTEPTEPSEPCEHRAVRSSWWVLTDLGWQVRFHQGTVTAI